MLSITKYYLKKLFFRFYSVNFKLFLIIAVFSFYISYELHNLKGSGCSVFEYALLALSDYYYFIFFFLIIYGTIIFGEIKDSSPLVLERTKKYGYYYVGKLTAVSVFTISIVFLHVVTAFLIGSNNYEWDNTFASVEGPMGEISMIFRENFKTPCAALIAVCLYMITGLCIYSGIMILLSHYISDKMVILFEMVWYLTVLVSLQLHIDTKMPLIFFINYLFLHRALMYNIPFLTIICSAIVLFFLIFMSGLWRQNIKKFVLSLRLPVRLFGELFTYKKLILLIFTNFVLSILNIIKYRYDVKAGSEYATAVFMGYGTGYFNLVDFLHLVILNGIPIYILSVYFGNKDSMRSNVMIRYRKRRDWFWRIQYSIFLIILIQWGLQCVFNYLLGTAGIFFNLAGNQESIIFTGPVPLACLYITGFGLRVLELIFLQILYFLILSFSRNETTSFLITMSLYLSVIFFDNKWIPFGLSSLCRMIDMDIQKLFINALISGLFFLVSYLGICVYIVKCDAMKNVAL